MSREVLGEAGTGVEPPAPPLARAASLQLTPVVTSAETRAGATPEPRPPDRSPPPRFPGWRGSRWTVLAAFAAGALVATAVTTGVLQRQHESERMAAVRLLAEFELRQNEGSVDMENGLLNLNLLVYNGGQDSLEVTGASFADSRGSTIGVREATEVPAGTTVRVPAQLRLDCHHPQPRALDLTVRTLDDRTRTVPAASLVDELFSANPFDSISWLCSARGGPAQVDLWALSARDDGTLSMQLRNASDKPITVSFTGPAGTRIVTQPASPVTVPARHTAFLLLAVHVDRCTDAAQRAAAGEDLQMDVDGDSWGSVSGDSPTTVAGWLARSVALVCH
ncbi:MAG: hypothetical protein ACLGIA_13980 [Actinomycetes bacterium]